MVKKENYKQFNTIYTKYIIIKTRIWLKGITRYYIRKIKCQQNKIIFII